MAKFNIEKDSIKLIGETKVGLTVTLKSTDDREKTFYHEVESVDKEVIEQELQKLANSFEEVVVESEKELPSLVTNKDLEVELLEV